MTQYDAFTLSASGLVHCLKTYVYVCLHEEAIKQDITQHVKAQAVWDTGATITCVSPNTAKALNLVPIGLTEMHTANGIVTVERYKIGLILPNQISIPDLTVSSFCGGPDVDMLIGMDVICRGDFSITNANKKTVMSYRIPSGDMHIDYVKSQTKKS